jgi:demethylmenaquinone methyltransferase/2-methoxy-6-polyprenyl-1,4-benzoquinol methylase
VTAAAPAGSGSPDPAPNGRAVRAMFARVARRYDRANHVLSLGIDLWWRRAAVRYCALVPGERVLDVCSGTGDLALALGRRGAEVVGSDFCPEMLAVARDKAGSRGRAPRFVAADTQRLPFADGSFDAATVAFGIRNVADPVQGLREMARVVRPGGRVVVLEFTRPRVPLVRGAYLLYFRRILPSVGRWVTGDRHGAYEYLPASVLRFPEREEFVALMRSAGLVRPHARVLTCGIAAVYRGEVAARESDR